MKIIKNFIDKVPSTFNILNAEGAVFLTIFRNKLLRDQLQNNRQSLNILKHMLIYYFVFLFYFMKNSCF